MSACQQGCLLRGQRDRSGYKHLQLQGPKTVSVNVISAREGKLPKADLFVLRIEGGGKGQWKEREVILKCKAEWPVGGQSYISIRWNDEERVEGIQGLADHAALAAVLVARKESVKAPLSGFLILNNTAGRWHSIRHLPLIPREGRILRRLFLEKFLDWQSR